MGGIGLVVQFAKTPRPEFHRELWLYVMRTMRQKVKKKVTKGFFPFYLIPEADDGFARGNWRADEDGCNLSFGDGGGGSYLQMYAGFHWTAVTMNELFADLQDLAKYFGGKLKKTKFPTGSHVFFFDGQTFVGASKTDVWTMSPKEVRRFDPAEYPKAAKVKELLKKKKCECEICKG